MNALACLISALKTSAPVCRIKGQYRDGEYSGADIGLSTFSVFFMGSPSFEAVTTALRFRATPEGPRWRYARRLKHRLVLWRKVLGAPLCRARPVPVP